MIKYKAPTHRVAKSNHSVSGVLALNSVTSTSRKSSMLPRLQTDDLHYPILSTPFFMSPTQSAWQTRQFITTHWQPCPGDLQPASRTLRNLRSEFSGKYSKGNNAKIGFLGVNGEGNGTPLQYSCLENPMDGGAW